jgi:primosomal protein N' (replication factor Y)
MVDSPAKPSHRPGNHVAVLLALPLPAAYDYRVPEQMVLSDGDFVRVPLGRRQVNGVVWGTGSNNVDKSKIKDVVNCFTTPPMSDVSRAFVNWVAAYTISPPGAILKMSMSVPAALEEPKLQMVFGLNPSPPDFKMTSARQRVIDVLKNGEPPLAGGELAREAAVGTSVVSGLVKAGGLLSHAVVTTFKMASPDGNLPGLELSKIQAQAGAVLAGDVAKGGFAASLLDGVPGSGKTEVYFEAVAEALKQNRQVLVLLPEIALSAQWLERFERRFGASPAQWHSDLSSARRRDTWRAVAQGEADVVVGTRSALFLPFKNLALIVVDEEHEGAFKQEEGVIYNARDMAVVRAHLANISIVLASATPSLETVANVRRGRYRLVHLPQRHGGAKLPDVSLIDMREEGLSGGRWLSPRLVDQVKQTLAAGEQAMLFLNRRGYAPLTLCRTCGYRFKCPNCTAWLVTHRRGVGCLQCHHCGYSTALPESCPSCEKETLAACGPGVERLSEEVEELFPNIRTEIATSDSIGGPVAAAEFVQRIENHEVDLIIGTQIVAKGYHFPLLTLVGVVDADLGLSGGDLRAAERTYQLLYQVAGRAGRAQHPGRVMLQTYMPEHPVVQALLSGDREKFIETETKARKASEMPPFSRLAALIVSGLDETEVNRVASLLAREAPHFDNILILGPAPAPLSIIRGRHRRRFLVRAPKQVDLQHLLSNWLASVPVSGGVRIQADIDPYSFL